MSNINDAIDQIMSEKPGAAYDTIKEILASKIHDALLVRKAEIASTFVSDNTEEDADDQTDSEESDEEESEEGIE